MGADPIPADCALIVEMVYKIDTRLIELYLLKREHYN